MGYEAIAMCDYIGGKNLENYNADSKLCLAVHTCMDIIKEKANIRYK